MTIGIQHTITAAFIIFGVIPTPVYILHTSLLRHGTTHDHAKNVNANVSGLLGVNVILICASELGNLKI